MRTHGNKSACAYAFSFDSRINFSPPSITHSYLVFLLYQLPLIYASLYGDKVTPLYILIFDGQ